MQPFLVQISIILILFLMAAFFAGAETSLFSLKKGQLHRLRNSEKNSERILFDLMKNPSAILATILAGNLLIHILLSSIATTFFLSITERYGHILAISIITPCLILLGEITPKVIVLQNPEYYSRIISPGLSVIHKCLYPFRIIFSLITLPFIRSIQRAEERTLNVTHREIELAIDESEQKGNLNPDEADFMRNVMRFPLKEASNIMIPRNQAVFISESVSVSDAIDIFRETGIVRAPVYRSNPDDIVGLLDVRDLIPFTVSPKEAKKMKIVRYVKPIHFFPSSKKIGDLLNEFLSRKIQIAIVIDEYGGTAGIVTLSSLIIEIMGKEFTLSDEETKDDIIDIGHGRSIIHGDFQINDFNAVYDESLESNESDTVAGYIIEQTGHFPSRNTVIFTDRYRIRVRSIRKNRIETLEVSPRDEET
ncbi:MAG TPA: hemolysin family protein [Spirochaetota bacterium]